MLSEYKFPIPHKYTKSQKDITEIEEHQQQKGTNQSIWASSYPSFKKNIKNHLKKVQHERCMFCRRVIDESQCLAELEHLVPKAKYPQFETLPDNIVLTCHRCNNHKGSKDPLVNSIPGPLQSIYPTTSAEFRTIYPYADKYEDHIDIDNIGMAKSLSLKGDVTIEWYDLNRDELVSKRKEDVDRKTFSRIRQLMLTLRESTDQTQNDILLDIKNIIDQL